MIDLGNIFGCTIPITTNNIKIYLKFKESGKSEDAYSDHTKRYPKMHIRTQRSFFQLIKYINASNEDEMNEISLKF